VFIIKDITTEHVSSYIEGFEPGMQVTPSPSSKENAWAAAFEFSNVEC